MAETRDEEPSDIQLIREVLDRYQRAHREFDWETVRACHDETYIRWFGCGSTDIMDWVPHVCLTQGEMQEWGETRMPEGAHYEQEHRILKTDIRGNMAISVVRERGCWRSDSGEIYSEWDCHTMWFTGRINGTWKILAAFFPDLGPLKSDIDEEGNDAE